MRAECPECGSGLKQLENEGTDLVQCPECERVFPCSEVGETSERRKTYGTLSMRALASGLFEEHLFIYPCAVVALICGYGLGYLLRPTSPETRLKTENRHIEKELQFYEDKVATLQNKAEDTRVENQRLRSSIRRLEHQVSREMPWERTED